MNMQAPIVKPAVAISKLEKSYDSGFTALKKVDLEVRSGEIFALLGPNGAGKTTLIGAVCGLVRPTGGQILVGGHDVVTEFRKTRSMIGLVPQELSNERYANVWETVSFSRALFGKARNDAVIEKILRDLSLWDKRHNMLYQLSGGMKRRVLIAKALSHEPQILFLDEPTAGVDVELRRDMWKLVQELKRNGTTIVLTTHYLDEAEEVADRIGVISTGEIILVEEKIKLMAKFGRKDLTIQLQRPLTRLPPALSDLGLKLSEGGGELLYGYDTHAAHSGIADLMAAINAEGLSIQDLSTHQSSLEDIFISLLKDRT
ncbi:ABC transporter ATP-binding protein [Rhizobium leguminosarum]|uniref:ABC transporter ATP-binding protein n=1 Tax=Rhizobium leguminosarum TaxID=384 RepID=UPI001F1C02CE|nr:ABC transporter ATP-binding protein [Rhizobium leguminosarum]UIJ83184.1 ABC transporter ATP-binding protein [Rhizobium leguminosarum]